VPVGTFTCVLLYDGEVGIDVPVEPHDRPVTAAASPSGIVRFAPTF
jgi:5-formyltetrahydrofolate cyclo-ligase